jgi:hypothetical protein
MTDFEGETGYPYRDDRMFVLGIETNFEKLRTEGGVGGYVSSLNGRREPDPNSPVLLATYRNTINLPSIRVDEFKTYIEACEYVRRVEPTCPRLSLGGEGPQPTPSWDEHLAWLHSNGLRSVLEGDDPFADWVRERERRRR